MTRATALAFLSALVVTLSTGCETSRIAADQTSVDERVARFLAQHRDDSSDLNVPEADGRALHDIVLNNGYKSALEIRTSTGHSGIWIAWALAKTGGRLTTIEIDEGRYRKALRNFQEAGLGSLIDARFADTHYLVPKLDGPFDFVFIDADRAWYTNYAKAVIPKLRIGGCLAAHDVTADGVEGPPRMTADFYDYITTLPFLETTIITSGAGLSVSFKRGDPDLQGG
jgi:caffeoyl-CoA O-methyltransferase